MNERIAQDRRRSRSRSSSRRVDALGTTEPTIQRQGDDRILVQVPGLQDPTQLKDLLGKTAKLEFRMVDPPVPPDQAQQGELPPAPRLPIEPELADSCRTWSRRRCWSRGEDLIDAQPGFDQRTNEPIVNFRFNQPGARVRAGDTRRTSAAARDRARQQGDLGARHPRADHRRLGPDLRQLHGRARQRPRDPAARRRAAGASSPSSRSAPSVPASARTSIEAGKLAAYVGAVLVVVFMLLTYGLFGFFANIALAVHVGLIFGLMSLLGADADAAGHRRHRAHHRHGGRFQRADLRAHPRGAARPAATPISAIDAGFQRAFATIIDSNSPRSSPPPSCSSSAPARCAASP